MDTLDIFYNDSCKSEMCCCKCKFMFFLKNQITLNHLGYICTAAVYFNIEYGENNTDVYQMATPHGECEMFFDKHPIKKLNNKKRE